MKTILILAALLAACLNLSAQPAPAGNLLPTGAGAPTTNTTILSPNGLFLSTVIYSPVTALAKAHVFSWEFPLSGGVPDVNVAGFEFVYGDLYTPNTNRISVAKSITQFAFVNTLNTNQTYYFYVVSTNSAGQRAQPSNVVIYQPPSK